MMNMLAIFGLGTPEIIAILVIVFLLFGAKKLPNLPADWARAWENSRRPNLNFEEELLKTEKETMSNASTSKTEVRPSLRAFPAH